MKTTQTSTYSESELLNILSSLAIDYKQTMNKDLIQKMFKVVKLLLFIYKSEFKSYSKFIEPTIIDDCAIDFLSKLLTGKPVNPVPNTLKKILNYRIDEAKYTPSNYILDPNEIAIDLSSIDDQMLLEEKINDILEGLDDEAKYAVLYYINNLDEFINSVTLLKPSPWRTLVTTKVYEIHRMIYKVDSGIDRVPNSLLGRNLMLSSLYKLNPMVVVLMILLKDSSKVQQFLTMYGGQTVEIPTLEQVTSQINKAGVLAEKLENDDLSIRDREALAVMATQVEDVSQIDADVKLTPILEQFILESIKSSFKLVTSANDKLIESMDGRDPATIMNVFKTVNTELTTQSKLFREIVSTINQSNDLSVLLDQLTSQKEIKQ